MTRRRWRERLNDNLGFILTILTIFFLIAQFAIIPLIVHNEVHPKVINSVTQAALSNWVVASQLLFFVFAQALLYVLLIISVYLSATSIRYLFKLSFKMRNQLGIILWFLAVIEIILANNYFFPRSKYALISNSPTPFIILHYATAIIGAVLLLAFCLGLLGLIWSVWKRSHKIVYVGFPLCLILGLLYQLPDMRQAHAASVRPLGKPNVIMIGVDSLRADYVMRNGAARNVMPVLTDFLQGATNFTQAYTPQARTLSAWMSMFTGRYPTQHGAIFSLTNFNEIDKKIIIPTELKKRGYQTVFALDERRFMNIDHDFGFDIAIGPKVGFNDFILGTLNDFPISNLVLNTAFGRWLFPFNHANRASAVNFYPSTFTNLLKKQLPVVDDKPVFLAVHYCLPHWPYAWARETPVARDKFSIASVHRTEVYEETLSRVDKQLKSLLTLLKERHYLNHAIVIILSDHGESIGLEGDRLTKAEGYVFGQPRPYDLDRLFYRSRGYGHGNDVLALNGAHHVLLAMKSYGLERSFVDANIKVPVSLVDVTPTLYDLLGIHIEGAHLMGESLKPFLYGKQVDLAKWRRPLFTEAGLHFASMDAGTINVSELSLAAAQLYDLEKDSGRLVLRKDLKEKLDKRKQRGVMYDGWYLVSIPYDPTQDAMTYRFLLFNLKTGQWTDNLGSDFAKSAPVSIMFKQMKSLYGDKVKMNSKA